MSNYLPLEVVEEILVNQPAKSLMRFRSVCKTWYSLISNSCFATAHLARSNQRPSPYFLFGRGCRGKQRFSLHSNPAMDSSNFTEFQPPYEGRYANFKLVGSVNGLICLVDGGNFILWNPSINRYVQLPDLHRTRYICCHGFGYHAPTNEYKVMRIRYSERDENTLVAEIYSFNNGECRLLTFSASAPIILRQDTASVFMNGALHWLVRRTQNPRYNFIMSFNLGDETVFHEVPMPKVLETENNYQYNQYYSLLTGFNIVMLNGLLALYGGVGPLEFHHNKDWLAKKHDVWVMKEYGVVEFWTKLYVIDLSERWGMVIGFKKNGEVLVTFPDRYPSCKSDLSLYEPYSLRKIWNLQINETRSCFYLDNYVESLVLLDGIKKARVIKERKRKNRNKKNMKVAGTL
ncbi:F-box/kelch-repeat protein At3g23880-like [Castanea sativa]|uniref:F-box/kelch-repeat protein At3g23880-like n=1 Tax=Castanea sativa TaxID=21020 RepID=UPI003F64EA85